MIFIIVIYGFIYYFVISLYLVKSCSCLLDLFLGILFCFCLIFDVIVSCVLGLGIGGSWRRFFFGNGLEIEVGFFIGKLLSDLELEEEDVCKRKNI